MKTQTHLLLALIPIGLLMGSCASTQGTTAVSDDVYFMPSKAPAPAMASTKALPTEAAQAAPTDDYYDAKTSQQLGADRDYYDMTYNDPYFYNYGRFGFGTGLAGWQNGWNGPGWGMSMGYGWGSIYGAGGYGMYSPYGNGFCSPWNNFYGGGFGSSFYGGGYGYGNYYNPYGNYGSGYVPVSYGSYGDYRPAATYHRPSMGVGSGTRSSVAGTRPDTRNLIGLAPSNEVRSLQENKMRGYRNTGLDGTREQRYNDTQQRSGTRPSTGRIQESRTTRPSIGSGGSIGGTRSSPSPGGGGGGTRSTPQRR